MNVTSFLLRTTRLVRRSIFNRNVIINIRMISGGAQKGPENRSSYLNYSWWKKRQAQKDKYYTSSGEEYEEHAEAMSAIKDANPYEPPSQDMPAFNYDLQREGSEMGAGDNKGYIPKSLDPMNPKNDTDSGNNARMAVYFLGAVPIVGFIIYYFFTDAV